MEPAALRRGAGTPRGVALTGHVPPVLPEERPPCMARVQRDVLLPEVPTEEPPCHRQTLTAATEMLQETSAAAKVPREMLLGTDELPAEAVPPAPSAVLPAEPRKGPCGIEQPSCPRKWRTCPNELPPIVAPVLPTSPQMPAEQPSQLFPRGSHSSRSCHEERTTNHQDLSPGQEPGSEGFIHWHDHFGLLAHQLHSCPTDRTTTKMTYRPPHRALLQGQGLREAMLKSMLFQKYRKKMLGESPPLHIPMELVSTTHRDYCARGCQLMPLPTTQPHNYRTEQPCTFWLEQAHSLPGVTSIRSGDSPFRRNAAFSTPITEYLGPPLPCATPSSQIWSHKQ